MISDSISSAITKIIEVNRGSHCLHRAFLRSHPAQIVKKEPLLICTTFSVDVREEYPDSCLTSQSVQVWSISLPVLPRFNSYHRGHRTDRSPPAVILQCGLAIVVTVEGISRLAVLFYIFERLSDFRYSP